MKDFRSMTPTDALSREIARQAPVRIAQRVASNPIGLFIATTDFNIDFPCTESMSGTVVRYNKIAAVGESSQVCHEEDTSEETAYQMRKASCEGGATETIAQEPILDGDLLYCWYNPQASRWEVLQHIYNRCSTYCGWDPTQGNIFSSKSTISGTMDADILDAGGGVKAVKTTGTGEVIALGTIKLTAYATSMLTLTAYPVTDPATMTGRFWYGISSGNGVLVDLDAQTLTHVSLNADGTINVVYNSVAYPDSMWPPLGTVDASPLSQMGWCDLDCERLSILGAQSQVSPLAHWPYAQPHVDSTLVFGSTVPNGADGTWWRLKAVCTETCQTCSSPYGHDWVKPGEAAISGASGQTGVADYNSSGVGISLGAIADVSNNVLANATEDPSGVQWVFSGGIGCEYQWMYDDTAPEWMSAGAVTVWTDPVVSTSKIVANAEVRLYFSSEIPPVTFADYCLDSGAYPSTGEAFIAIRYSLYRVSDASATRTMDRYQHIYAVYSIATAPPEDATTATFSRVGTYSKTVNTYSDGSFLSNVACADAAADPLITGFPSTIDSNWVITAPACGASPPTTTTSTSTTTAPPTTTATSTTTAAPTTTDTSTTTAAPTTTASSTTDTSSTTPASTTDTSSTTAGSTTTANPCTGSCDYIGVIDGCGGSPTGFSWSGNGNSCSGVGCGCPSSLCTTVVSLLGWPSSEGQLASIDCRDDYP